MCLDQGSKSKQKKLRSPIVINRRSEKKSRSIEDSRYCEIAIIAILDFRFQKIPGAKNMPESSLFYMDSCGSGLETCYSHRFGHFRVSLIGYDHISLEISKDVRRDEKLLPVRGMK